MLNGEKDNRDIEPYPHTDPIARRGNAAAKFKIPNTKTRPSSRRNQHVENNKLLQVETPRLPLQEASSDCINQSPIRRSSSSEESTITKSVLEANGKLLDVTQTQKLAESTWGSSFLTNTQVTATALPLRQGNVQDGLDETCDEL